MARIFISHAHTDGELAQKLVGLLRSALGLAEKGDIFYSSREGTGVAPGASIRPEVIENLRDTSALIVLLTPESVENPWVWLEAGARLAQEGKPNPLFVVPQERFKTLPRVIPDLRSLSLDNDGELHELVAEVATQLKVGLRQAVDYNRELQELNRLACRKYSKFNEQRMRVRKWARGNAVPIFGLSIVILMLIAYMAVQDSRQQLQDMTIRANDFPNTVLAEVLQWDGELMLPRPSSDNAASAQPCAEIGDRLPSDVPIRRAVVMAWKASVSGPKDDRAACLAPNCTSDETSDDGGFHLDLTKLKIGKSAQIVLVVKKPAEPSVSCRLNVIVNPAARTSSAVGQTQRFTLRPVPATAGSGL
jgi:hypothetical protein